MTARVFVAPQAEALLSAAVGWWRTTYPATSTILTDEFEEAVRLVAAMPEVGAPFSRTAIPGVRRLLLQKTKYWVYYAYDVRHAVVYVLAVWSARRGTPPPGVAP